eukprot:7560251-Pyramimonas_sp.AAC.1
MLAECPSLLRPYIPFPGLTNGHVETVLAALYRKTPEVRNTNSRLDIMDTVELTITTLLSHRIPLERTQFSHQFVTDAICVRVEP